MSAEEAKQVVQEKAAQAKEAPKQAKPTAEKQANCLACNKPIIKLRRYYRDGKFYCNKRCWRKHITKSKEEKK